MEDGEEEEEEEEEEVVVVMVEENEDEETLEVDKFGLLVFEIGEKVVGGAEEER